MDLDTLSYDDDPLRDEDEDVELDTDTNPMLSDFMSMLLEENETLKADLISDNAAILPEDLSFTINLLRLNLSTRSPFQSSFHSSTTSLPELSRWESHVVTSPTPERVELSLKKPQRRRSEEGSLQSAEDPKIFLGLPNLQQEQPEPTLGSEEEVCVLPCKHELPPKVPLRRGSSQRMPSPPPFDPGYEDEEEGSVDTADSSVEDMTGNPYDMYNDDAVHDSDPSGVEDSFEMLPHSSTLSVVTEELEEDLVDTDLPSLEIISNPPHRRSWNVQRQQATRDFAKWLAHPAHPYRMQRQNATRNIGLDATPPQEDVQDCCCCENVSSTKNLLLQDIQIPPNRSLRDTQIPADSRLPPPKGMVTRNQAFELMHSPNVNHSKLSLKHMIAEADDDDEESPSSSPVNNMKKKGFLGKIKKQLQPKAKSNSAA